MRAKRTNRKNEDGDLLYDYLCQKKEKSCRQLCSIKNINGNNLDHMLMKEIARLPLNYDDLILYLRKTKNTLIKNFDKEIKRSVEKIRPEICKREYICTIEEETIEEKREIIQCVIKKIIWDGENIHVILFGSDYKYHYPNIPIHI